MSQRIYKGKVYSKQFQIFSPFKHCFCSISENAFSIQTIFVPLFVCLFRPAKIEEAFLTGGWARITLTQKRITRFGFWITFFIFCAATIFPCVQHSIYITYNIYVCIFLQASIYLEKQCIYLHVIAFCCWKSCC